MHDNQRAEPSPAVPFRISCPLRARALLSIGTSMFLSIVRALFILLMAAVGWFFFTHDPTRFQEISWLYHYSWLALAATLIIGVIVICVDILAPRKKLFIFSGTVLGLIVGLFIAYALSFVVSLLIDQTRITAGGIWKDTTADALRNSIDIFVGVICCYLSISFILQTKDDFRFVIPFVEFRRQAKGPRPFILDTSILIDGRINDIALTGIFESTLIVPRFVVSELQLVADSEDRLKRGRGRRGLEVLERLRANDRIELNLYESSARHDDRTPVDEQLMELTKQMEGRLLTNDFNLHKVAGLRGIPVINLNDLSTALRSAALPGETLRLRLIKPGEEPGQAIGYLEDGTMVVVEQGRPLINTEAEVLVTNSRQTAAGRMIFARLADATAARRGKPVKIESSEH
jgi:uncharacterized protein YacL